MPSYSAQLNYPPWVGSAYGRKGARKVLLLGRSYADALYGDRSPAAFLKDSFKAPRTDPFFHAAEMILSEKEHWKRNRRGALALDRRLFWRSMAFHQYIQGILEGAAPPDREMWRQAREIYKNQFAALAPEIVVVFGEEVFDALPTMGGRPGPEFRWEGARMPTWQIPLGDRRAVICRMPHPRDGRFRPEVWKNLYARFLGDYKQRHGKVFF